MLLNGNMMDAKKQPATERGLLIWRMTFPESSRACALAEGILVLIRCEVTGTGLAPGLRLGILDREAPYQERSA